MPNRPQLRLVKGSHIVVPQLFEDDHAYILQNADRRIVFAIPYEGDFTLIGTTDVPYERRSRQGRDRRRARSPISASVINALFRPADRAAPTWSGAIPACGRCYDDDGGKRLGGDARLCARARRPTGARPLLSVFGGKITTYPPARRACAGEARAAFFPKAGPAWTRTRRRCPAATSPMAISRRFLRSAPRAALSLAAGGVWRCAGAGLWHRASTGCWRRRIAGRSRSGIMATTSTSASSTICADQEWARSGRRRPVAPLQARACMSIARRTVGAHSPTAFAARRGPRQAGDDTGPGDRRASGSARRPAHRPRRPRRWSRARSTCCSARRWPARRR